MSSTWTLLETLTKWTTASQCISSGVTASQDLWDSGYITTKWKGHKECQSQANCQISKVQSEVSQGSVLDPLLFSLHVSDIDAKLENSTATSSVDDTRIKMKTRAAEDTILLNNNMALNGGKFELMRFGNNEVIKPATNYHYNNQAIQ